MDFVEVREEVVKEKFTDPHPEISKHRNGAALAL